MFRHRPLCMVIVTGLFMAPAAAVRGIGKAVCPLCHEQGTQARSGAGCSHDGYASHETHNGIRYTTRAQARHETRHGLAVGNHMTSRSRAGRPLSPKQAQKRYGLPETPEVRQTWTIPAGTPLRHNKAIAGARGEGEVTSTARRPPEASVRTIQLR